MAETFLSLLTSHLLADFIFQTNGMVENKKHPLVLLQHVFVVTSTTFLLLRSFHWPILMTTFVTHLGFDYLKSQQNKDTWQLFSIDQLAHLSVIVAIAIIYPNAADQGWWPFKNQVWQEAAFYVSLCFIAGVILNVRVGGILIGKLTDPIRKQIQDSKIIESPKSRNDRDPTDDDDDYLVEGIEHGGIYIGWLERSMTMLLILVGQPNAIGFLIAAKSVMRFGEIKQAKHRKLAEYIIIGSFLSIGWGILVSAVMLKAMENWWNGL